MGKVSLCPCGSGKAYKDCHGSSKVVQINPDDYDAQLHELNADFVLFSALNFDLEINQIFENYEDELFDENSHLYETFITAVIPWVLLKEPMDNGKTIFDRYYASRYRKIKSTRVRKLFASWKDSVPSFYHIISVDDDTMLLQDIRTSDTYPILLKYILLEEEPNFIEGDILVGAVIPFFKNYQLLISALELSHNKEDIVELVSDLTDPELKEYFPDILYEALLLNEVPSQIHWAHYTYVDVAILLEEKMLEKNTDPDLITAGINIWKVFTDLRQPIVSKSNGYAAAVDYVVQKLYLESDHQTQKELADEYESSAGTLSKHSRHIHDTIDDYLWAEKLGLESFLDVFKQEQIDDIFQDANSPARIAEDLLFEAQQEDDLDERKALINKAIELDPNNLDAYLLKAEVIHGEPRKHRLYQKAVDIGRDNLGEAFFKENKGSFWALIETRPFMRALAGLAYSHLARRELDEGIAALEELIMLNKSDNQGVRYTLLALYINHRKYEKGEELVKLFEEDRSANFLFNRALLTYHVEGLTVKAIGLLKEADKANPYVKEFMLGEKETPMATIRYIGVGDETEAIHYTQENKGMWITALPLYSELKKL